MLGFVVAILACTGTNCDMTNPEPGRSFPTYEACQAELSGKRPSLQQKIDQTRHAGRSAELLCVREVGTIIDVEEPYDVTDTAIVHSDPSADSSFIGVVESGQRILVTGLVTGTKWVRVVLPDGKSGYVFGDHLKIGGRPAVAEATPPTPPASPRTANGQSPAPVTSAQPPVQPTSAPIATRRAVSAQRGEFRDCQNCPTMLSIAGGEFTMGSTRDASERPVHRVRLRSFALAKLELSTLEWSACVRDQGCEYQPPAQDPATARRPITNLSWEDATQYVEWLAKKTARPYRLPTEAEWEYAARAGGTTRYSWGEDLQSGRADCDGCEPRRDGSGPADLASFPPNGWGLFDMEGSVAEWMEDCWHASYRGAPVSGDAWRNASCDTHVLRGGSWNNPPADITVSSRNFYDGSVRYPGNGLRVALSLGPQTP